MRTTKARTLVSLVAAWMALLAPSSATAQAPQGPGDKVTAQALFDTHLQAIELLRDTSHGRDYSVAEWTAGLVGLFHRFGLRAFAWDVQEARHLRAVLAMQVDGVYSDHVDRMVATVAEWAEQ